MTDSEDEHKVDQDRKEQPEYLRHWGGLSMRKGGEIVAALPEDVAVAKSYPTTNEKGEIAGGTRLTILTKKTRYRVYEEVRVIHVKEVVEPGHQLFIMGPKTVYGEYVDDRLVTPQRPTLEDYDGAVLESPNVDYNYDITSYRFFEPGHHRIYWQPDEVRSNTLDLDVRTDD